MSSENEQKLNVASNDANLRVVDEMENVTFEVEQEVSKPDTRDNYKYTKVDCLEEDEPIVGQRFVLLSFISPEGIMNCKVRGVKVRGVYDDYTKAQKMANKLNKIDTYHHIYVGEVGKWMPWDPTPAQVEEEKFANDDLNKIMKKAHESELKKKQQDDLQDLNELVGRHKETMELKSEQHENRVQEKIKQGAREIAKTSNQNTESTVTTTNNETEEIKQKTKARLHNNRDIEATKERLRKKVEENRQKKQEAEAGKFVDRKQQLEEKVKKLKEETARIANKEQDAAALKAEKEKIEENLKKMQELYAKKSD